MPKLRFIEFKDDEKWEITAFGKLSIPVEERAGEASYTLMSVTSGVGLIPQTEKFGREIAGNSYKNYYVIQNGDFAYNKSATKLYPEGYIAMLQGYDNAALPNSIFTCFRIVDKESYPQFFNHLFSSNYHGKWLRKYITVGARANGALSVDNKYLWKMPVAVPKLSEQQKIADCFSSLDDLISAENEKLLALKDHKKGLMQNLFPAEGKSIPEWRFSEFRICGSWEEKKLEEAVETITDYVAAGSFADLKSKVNYKASPDFAQLVRTVDIKNNFKNKDFVYVNREAFKFLWRVDLNIDAIIMPNIGANIGEVYYLKSRLLPYENNVLGPNALLLRCNKNNNTFISNLLLSDMFQRLLKLIVAASGQPKFNKTELKQITICIPTLPEQQKIADCLTALDDLITAQSQKIEVLKQHKKALIQGLFPSAQEVF